MAFTWWQIALMIIGVVYLAGVAAFGYLTRNVIFSCFWPLLFIVDLPVQ